MFPGVIEQVLAEQYQPYTKEKTERKKWEKVVSRVADSEDESVIGEHNDGHPPGYYKSGKKRTKEKKPDFKDLYKFTAINFLV